jgi:cytochrome c oxidase assembly protein subunit 15
MAERSTRPVAIWLLVCCAMIFAVVVIGGITRLTWSGLSITEWQPVTGIVPPLSAADWQAEFAKYRQTSQYKLLNTGMSLGDFQTIFLWEYVHRLWGRLIGFVYLLPFLYFLIRGRIPRRLAWPLAGIFALGFAQGALGWYMVESGLADRIEVSQYRLTAHLALALVIYAATLWTALGLLENPSPPFRGEREGPAKRQGEVGVGERSGIPHLTPALSAPKGREGGRIWRRASEAVLALVSLTIIAGGFVAGLNAGLVYNTFPLMDGSFVPADYAQLSPFIRNWFENVAAVQFDHRILAMTTVASVTLLWLAGIRAALPRRAKRALHVLLAVALLQLSLGISTLLLVVPIPLAATHQAGAVLLLTAAIVLRHALRSSAKLDATARATI